MSKFGWSLPPGCGALPGEEEHATDLTPLVNGLADGTYVWWLEDGVIEAQVDQEVLFRIDQCEFDDEVDEQQNLSRAAAVAQQHVPTINHRRALVLSRT